jgi:hypothetical protein
MKRMIVQLKDDDQEWLKSYAKSRGVSMAKVMRDLVSTQREKHERKQEPKQY